MSQYTEATTLPSRARRARRNGHPQRTTLRSHSKDRAPTAGAVCGWQVPLALPTATTLLGSNPVVVAVAVGGVPTQACRWYRALWQVQL
ncbi:hypothetical protein PsYK624_075360 [Phanerochaete sordida]|uniref:Uncharacterized protein n=1 Tax=Phanerochaete sordida TaxID=48140 RepID=A0A9P3GAN6_9APHY|nr:hypothetical protein PsYK624_075360 [Phanerochaete sordida]